MTGSPPTGLPRGGTWGLDMSEVKRKAGYYWVREFDTWTVWWLSDMHLLEYPEDDVFEEIGPRIPAPDEPLPAPYGWACENRHNGILLGVRFVQGERPGRSKRKHWFPVWRAPREIESILLHPSIVIEGGKPTL